jgi:glycosyltransferase involved in cell wall biosynthesis
MRPKVSFIIPCYNLAHFLGDCVNSILSQTYVDFEILIMDDCSPDNTQEVAAGFKDPRVTYIRNEPNLGHLRNYNKGIELARGRYIWLISADDCLRSRNVLEKFVEVLDQNPNVGYVFCPAMTLNKNGEEVGVEEVWIWPGYRDRILRGDEVVRRSAYRCALISPTALVRKECYTRVGGFPLDQPRTGDWYLWAVFAMTSDVGYFAEPMVCYRRHDTNMDKIMAENDPSFFFEQEMLCRWSMKKEAENAGVKDVYQDFRRGLADVYASRLVDNEITNGRQGCSWEFAIQEIRDNTPGEEDAQEILRLIRSGWAGKLALGQARTGAWHYNEGRLDQAIIVFRSALKSNPWCIKSRIYLWVSRLERSIGIQLVPLLRLFKNTLLTSLRRVIRRSSILSSSYFYVGK